MTKSTPITERRYLVHIGDTEKRYDPKVIRSLLPLLEQGDILTHYFTANPGGVLDGNGKLVPEVRSAISSALSPEPSRKAFNRLPMSSKRMVTAVCWNRRRRSPPRCRRASPATG